MDDINLANLQRLAQQLRSGTWGEKSNGGGPLPAGTAVGGSRGLPLSPGVEHHPSVFRHLIHVIRRRWIWAAVAFVTVPVTATFWAYKKLPDQYEAVSTVWINPNAVSSPLGDDPLERREYISNERLKEMAKIEPTLVTAQKLIRDWASGAWTEQGADYWQRNIQLRMTSDRIRPSDEAQPTADEAGSPQQEPEKPAYQRIFERERGFIRGERGIPLGWDDNEQTVRVSADVLLAARSLIVQDLRETLVTTDANNVSITILALDTDPILAMVKANAVAAALKVEYLQERLRSIRSSDRKILLDNVSRKTAALQDRIYALRKKRAQRPEEIDFPLDSQLQVEHLNRAKQELRTARQEQSAVALLLEHLQQELANHQSGQPLVITQKLIDLDMKIEMARLRFNENTNEVQGLLKLRERLLRLGEQLLFRLSWAEFGADLQAGALSDALRQAFARQDGLSIAPEAVLSPKVVGRSWQIITGEQVYTVERDGEMLEIYARRDDLFLGTDSIHNIRGRLLYDISRARIEKAKLDQVLTELTEHVNHLLQRINQELSNPDSDTRKYELFMSDLQLNQEYALDLKKGIHRAQIAEQILSGSLAGTEHRQPLKVIVGTAERAGPNRMRYVIFGVLMGGILAVLLAFTLEHLDDGVQTPVDVRHYGGVPTLGLIERIADPRFIKPEEPQSRIAEEFAKLRNHIRYSARSAPERRMLISSPRKGDGKSYICTNLAISFAQEGNRVLLVDMDLRKGEPHDLAQAVTLLSALGPGLSGYLEGSMGLESVLVRTEMDTLQLLPSGGPAENVLKSLRSERMVELLEMVEQEFDIVLIDAPPVIQFADCPMIANMVRGVMLVVSCGRSRAFDLQEAVGRLRHVDAPLIGAVINRATRAEARSYGYVSYTPYY